MAAALGALGQGLSDAGSTYAQVYLAKQQMKWMQRMRETAYQTMVKDLTQAGLNPALAFKGGNASLAHVPVPSTGGEGLAGKFDVVGAVEKAVSTARQAKLMSDQVRTVAAQRSTAETQADIARNTQSTQEKLLETQVTKNMREAGLLEAQAEQSNAQTIAIDVNRMLGETELPGARAMKSFDETQLGGVLREVRRVLDAMPGVSGGSRSRAR